MKELLGKIPAVRDQDERRTADIIQRALVMLAVAGFGIFGKKLKRLLPDPAVAMKLEDAGVEIVAVLSLVEEVLDRCVIACREKSAFGDLGVFERTKIADDLGIPIEIDDLCIAGRQHLAEDQLGHCADADASLEM